MFTDKQIRFLHIVKDDKFLSPTMKSFSLADTIASSYICYTGGKNLRFIKPEDGVEVFESARSFRKRLRSGDYDVVYLHSLQFSILRFIRSIPKDKVMIWWAWGYDIYGQQVVGMKSFINIDIFKPETKRLTDRFNLKRFFMRLWMEPLFFLHKREVLSRVDYFQPVCAVDYDLMKEHTGFKARLFYQVGRYVAVQNQVADPTGAILIGNAASPMENHLDVWLAVKAFIPEQRRIIIPLSYGEMEYAAKVKNRMSQDGFNLTFIDSYLPKKEYFSLFDSCSYAIFGTLRQHAMGNIYWALRKGIKLFLYRDSVLFQHLKQFGYVVFPIEEIDGNSFTEPLSPEDQQKNLDAFNAEIALYRETGEKALLEIKNSL